MARITASCFIGSEARRDEPGVPLGTNGVGRSPGATSEYIQPNQRGPLESAFQLTSLELLPLEEINV